MKQPPRVYRPQPLPKVLQTKLRQRPDSTESPAKAHNPKAPPAYSPQSTPKVLQRVKAGERSKISAGSPAAPPVYKPQPVPKCLQLKTATGQKKGTPSSSSRSGTSATAVQAKKIQPVAPDRNRRQLTNARAIQPKSRTMPGEHRTSRPAARNGYGVIQRALGPVVKVWEPPSLIDDEPPPLIDMDEMPVRIFDIRGENMRQIEAAPKLSVSMPPLAPSQPGILVAPSKPGILPFIRRKAEELNLTEELTHAVQVGAPVNLINLVFDILAPTQLEKLPTNNGKPFWDAIEKASLMVSKIGGFAKWLGIAKLRIIQIPGFKMLLTDARAQAAEAQALRIIAAARLPPKLEGKSYDEIVTILESMGFVRQEKYSESRGGGDPYGQDVWTSKDNLVIRMKVGGRSLAGKFPRPPHVVKEITATVHQYAPKDIICKMTDENILIPAGTKYSARDMQSWYEEVSGIRLPADAWEQPNQCGNQDFANLVFLWAEGAHTGIGLVPKF